MSVLTTTSKAPRRLVACPAPSSAPAVEEAKSWVADRLREEALTLGDAHRELAARFNEIRRTGQLAKAVA